MRQTNFFHGIVAKRNWGELKLSGTEKGLGWSLTLITEDGIIVKSAGVGR